MTGYSIPYASDDSIKDTVIGYYRASSSGGEVSPEKAADGADISEDSLRRQRGFLAEIGILKEGESGYSLTETGREIGRALRHERDDDAKAPFGELLHEWDATSRIMDDLGADYSTEEEVIDSIGYITDTEISHPRQTAGAKGLIGLYEWTGILEANKDGEYRVAEVESKTPDPDPPVSLDNHDKEAPDEPVKSQRSQSAPSSGAAPQKSRDPTTVSNALLDVSIELTGDEDPDNVHKLIVAVRSGLEKDITGDGHEPETRSDGGSEEESTEDSSLDLYLND